MAKNIIFYFTGTGNSLKTARDIAAALGDCELSSIPAYDGHVLPAGYERLGFIFPVYSQGLPNMVERFIETADLSSAKGAYIFTAFTFGGFAGTPGAHVAELLNRKGLTLNAAFSIRMFANYVAIYNMSADGSKVRHSSQKRISAVAEKIKQKEGTPVRKPNPLFAITHGKAAAGFAAKDKNYNLSKSCTGCGTCASVCPARNIDMQDNKPQFNHKCEQCMACIQCCPTRALNYKDKTQSRRRYINPEVTIADLKNSAGN